MWSIWHLFDRIGPEFLFYAGSLGQGICAIAFGFLAYAKNAQTFLAFSYVLKLLKDQLSSMFILVLVVLELY